MFSSKRTIWERLKVSGQEFDEACSHDTVMDELRRDYEEVVEALRCAETRSQAAGDAHTPDLELVRLARDLEQEILERLSPHTKQPKRR